MVLQSALVRRVVHIGGALALLAACERPLEPAICPPIGAGDLVISELRGAQSGNNIDNQGQWIEVYNASGGEVDLRGLELLLRRPDGSDEGRILVRRTLTVAAGDRVVLSFFPDASHPAHTDYGWYPDFVGSDREARSLFDTGVVDLLGCDDLRIDRVIIPDLPSTGTWSLGVEPPDAAANDTSTSWCPDLTDDADPNTLGLPGTPGASNPPCPTPP